MMRSLSGVRDRYTVGIERSSEGRAVKIFGVDAAAEYEKARAMETALCGTGFHVPRALRCDADTGRIEFEYVEGAVLVQEIFEAANGARRFHQALRFNDIAARLLGTLHQRLTVPNSRPWQPPVFLAERAQQEGYSLSGADDVYLHCDYSPVNLLIDPEDELWVIDASPNAYFTDYPCLKGHPLVDVAGYTSKLLWPFRLRTHSRRWRKMATVLRRRFIANYEQSCGRSVDDRLLKIFESAVVRAFVEWKTRSRIVRAAAGAVARIGMRGPA
jgi:aminoglycoside phosphotransferase (APT) family kinase protein